MISPYAAEVSSRTRTEWRDYGHTLFYSDPSCPKPHEIRLENFLSMVQQLIRNAQDTYASFLPQGFTPPAIDTSKLNDNGSLGQSIFEQEPNDAIFAPLADVFYGAIISRGSEDFHQQEQILLEALLFAISVTIGIPPRAFQLARLLYKASQDKSHKRNLYIKKGVVVLGWVRSKARTRIYQPSLWALPTELGKLLLIYLGVIRPTSIKLLQDKGLHIHEESQTHIFTFMRFPKSKSCAWTTTHVNAILGAATKAKIDIALPPARLRQLMTAIYRHHFPTFICAIPFPTLIDYNQGAATHTVRGDGVQCDFNLGSSLTLSDELVSSYIGVSQVWQGVLQMRSNREGVFATVKTLGEDQKREDQLLALDLARWSIYRTLDGTLDKLKARREALNILEDLSWLDFPPEPVRDITQSWNE